MSNPDDGKDGGGKDGGGKDGGGGGPRPPAREAELISFPRGHRGPHRTTSHLGSNRSLIVRRSLLATAVGGVVPIPVMDDYLAGRVRAGMLMQIAERRHVDLSPSSAELLADPREGTAARHATMTAATLLALKLAWRKFFIVLGAGRRAEEMATTFQVGTLFDHFCAKLHVGAGLDRDTAQRIRGAMFAAIRETERAVLVGVFRDGGRVLGRSLSEAPSWVTRQFQRLLERYTATGGNPDITPDDPPAASGKPETATDAPGMRDAKPAEPPGGGGADTNDDAANPPDARWLDRAAALVERRISSLGSGYLESLLNRFDGHFENSQDRPRDPPEDQPPNAPTGSRIR